MHIESDKSHSGHESDAWKAWLLVRGGKLVNAPVRWKFLSLDRRVDSVSRAYSQWPTFILVKHPKNLHNNTRN